MAGHDQTATRTRLTADRSYFVRLDGNDANSGCANTPEEALRTIQAAIDLIYQALDLNGFQVTIHVGAGIHTDPVSVTGQPLGGHTKHGHAVQIIGDDRAPENVRLAVASPAALSLNRGAHLLVVGITFTNPQGGHGWNVSQATLYHRNCRFGDVAGDMISAKEQAVVRALGLLEVSGNAASFIHAITHSLVIFSGQEIHFAGNTFRTYLWGLNDSTVAIDRCLISGGRPTGSTRVHDHSLLNTYCMRNPDGWGFLGKGYYAIEDGSCVTADGYRFRRFHVRSDADGDQNDGLEDTPGRAFKSIQACIDHIALLPYNPAAFAPSNGVTISVGDGAYEGVYLWDLKYVHATLEGNLADPSRVVIAGAENAVVAAGRMKWTIKGFKLSATLGACIRAKRGAQIDYEAIEFASAGEYHVLALYGAVAVQAGDCSISGGALGHVAALYGGVVEMSGRTLSIAGRPEFSDAFIRSRNNSSVRASGTVFYGTAVGRRYDVRFAGTIDVGGAGKRAIPGTIAGTTGRRQSAGGYG